MARVLLIAFGVILTVYAFFDVIVTPKTEIRFMPKVLWAILVFVPFVGPILWLFFRNGVPPLLRGKGNPGGPRGPIGPDDDPDFLRGL